MVFRITTPTWEDRLPMLIYYIHAHLYFTNMSTPTRSSTARPTTDKRPSRSMAWRRDESLSDVTVTSRGVTGHQWGRPTPLGTVIPPELIDNILKLLQGDKTVLKTWTQGPMTLHSKPSSGDVPKRT
ncbi:hypothetical protein NLI96_g1165 [Meripilus lineatus]|uniref:Uncharacterized protein n=1 Tax=Meripilus lineatus TaxID=2056292 RepID=A0AAD5VAV0_9APHY|nr:hypothetical protein NLI96_g1165 [Physisporinus lineatus]